MFIKKSSRDIAKKTKEKVLLQQEKYYLKKVEIVEKKIKRKLGKEMIRREYIFRERLKDVNDELHGQLVKNAKNQRALKKLREVEAEISQYADMLHDFVYLQTLKSVDELKKAAHMADTLKAIGRQLTKFQKKMPKHLHGDDFRIESIECD